MFPQKQLYMVKSGAVIEAQNCNFGQATPLILKV